MNERQDVHNYIMKHAEIPYDAHGQMLERFLTDPKVDVSLSSAHDEHALAV